MICIVLVLTLHFATREQPLDLMLIMFFSLLSVGTVLRIYSIVCAVISE